MNQKTDSKKQNQERIPCPYCKELIMPGAVKCRFCGEKISKKDQNVKEKKSIFSTKVLYFIWLLCLIYFLSTSVFAKNYTDLADNFMLLAILVGGIVFLFLLLRVVQPKLFNNGKYGLITFLTFIAFFGILFNQEKVRALFGLPSIIEMNQPININESNQFTPPTPIPTKNINQVNKEVNAVPRTNTNLIDCTGPDGKVFKTTQEECENFNSAWDNPSTPDPNEIIKCTIHVNCGGGFVEMRRVDCDKMTCCEVDSKNTLKFVSKDQCNKEQDKWLRDTLNAGCTTLCSFSTEICYSLYEVGTDRANCIMDVKSQETKCLSDCYNYDY